MWYMWRTRKKEPPVLAGHPLLNIVSLLTLIALAGILAGLFLHNYMILVLAIFLLGDMFLLPFFVTEGMKTYRRYLALLFSLAVFAILIPLAPDVPYALLHQYRKVEGIPTSTAPELNKSSRQVGAVVSFQDLSFTLDNEGPVDLEHR